MPDKKEQIIETTDEEGNTVSFELIDVVTIDNIEYALLLTVQEIENDEESEVLVMRLKQDGEEYSFETLKDDEEFDKVAQYLGKLEDEITD